MRKILFLFAEACREGQGAKVCEGLGGTWVKYGQLDIGQCMGKDMSEAGGIG
jgi:hypothetical protein